MTLFLRDLMDRFDQLSLRERVIVLIAALLLIALIWDSAFMGPLDRERKGRLQQIDALRAEVSGLEIEVVPIEYRTGGEINTVRKVPGLTKFSNITLHPGDRVRLEVSGGGGYGNPKERDPAMVAEDLREGFVSRDAARRVYGYAPPGADD